MSNSMSRHKFWNNGMISYAQNLEDVMLWRALNHVQNGFYIDIGAWSPDLDSVTRFFYESGWRGINVEPVEEYLAQLKERRPNDINLGVAISDYVGTAQFHSVEHTGLSTLDAAVANRAAEAGWSVRSLTVPVTTLSKLWDKHVPQNQEVHFLKLDVEGLEESVIRGADWARHRPWIIVVEATAPMSQKQSHSAWDPLLQDQGYVFVWFDGLNRFYVAREKIELKEAFHSPPNIFDGFRRAQEIQLEARAEAAEARLSDQRSSLAALEAETAGLRQAFEVELGKLRQALETERIQREALFGPLQHFLAQTEWARKPLWIRLLFKRSGKPKKPLRQMLFHSNGRPRGLFRSLVLHADRRPRSPFQEWMSSHEYQRLRGAVRPSVGAADAISPGAELVARRIAAFRRCSSK